ncbi:hypothetical protein ACM01_44030 [Streptomyces viridochromogenes]|uniref:Secreted protein n=1 Tax=Streptomyces viridochromogenes TaxID=1938 RepID=A0A0J8BND5_STRVR|nr:hypothetical protein [Streptomyces viridochromogenes]KMS67095.1 hypothetical protein ACM01_44030 [Streptomyces viridochromogenes]KOG26299.1 hypothetical protein ADK36_03660 [Streptomyces viridochromogenes]KOG27733.1 hypothetical protein ADK35_04960 [Streptomyces viridochromogenes]
MSTSVIILVVVVAVVAVLGAAVLALRARGAQSGQGLKRRFGPEYERAVARHDGDAKAAERELAQRVERHGGLRERELEPEEAQRFESRWTAAQEHFVDSPKEAVDEADRLLADLAQARGFPDGAQYEEQLSALSVHHARHVQGYRHVHRLAHASVSDGRDGGRPGTEEMREAMIEARSLFEDLSGPVERQRGGSRESHGPREFRKGSDGHRGHLPWAFTGRHAKGS